METSTIHQADGGGEEEWAESQAYASKTLAKQIKIYMNIYFWNTQ